VTFGIPTVAIGGVPDPLPEGVHVLDVREDDEWRAGRIEGARHVPLHQLVARLGEMPEGQTLVVCRVGSRSARAVAYLQQQGYDAVNLGGGLLDWQAAGRALVSDTGALPQVL